MEDRRRRGGAVQRVFVVGCPRSGTTIVQALLSRHPDVFSLHETYFFQALSGDMEYRWRDRDARPHQRWYHRAGLAHAAGRRRLRELEQKYAVPTRRRAVPRRWGACARRFARLLDDAAAVRDCTHWVEKSPGHLLFIGEILRCIPDARFVHVLRNGLDVVASVVDADLRLENGDFRGGVAQWARRWNRAMALHRRYLGDPRHHFLCLEDLTASTAVEWQHLRTFMRLDPARPMLARPGSEVANAADEPWKAMAVTGVVRRVRGKSQALFGPQTLAWLRDNLSDYAELRGVVAARRSAAARLAGGATMRSAGSARI